MKTNKQKGFTLVELLIVAFTFFLVAVVGVVGFYTTLIKGNFWYSEDGVLRELRVDYPKVERVLKTTRNVFSDSEIVVAEEGKEKTYYLDSDILWNYQFRQKETSIPVQTSATNKEKGAARRNFWF